MAADAFKGLEQRMDAAKEAELAAYIMRDVELRQQNAVDAGVLAYGRKPIPRGRPNERFLQNTLRGVHFANRKAAEDEMWEQWDKRKRPDGDAGPSKEQEPAKKRSRGSTAAPMRSPSASSSDQATSCSSSSRGGQSDHHSIDELLSKRAVRGRGASGSRADETGPFLFPTDQQEKEEYDLLRHAQKSAAGPACPDWIRADLRQNSQTHAGEDASKALVKAKEAKRRAKKERKEKKKSKKLKKEKKKRRKRDIDNSD